MKDIHNKILNNFYDKICPICSKECTDKRRTTFHMNRDHIEEMKMIKEYKATIKELSQKDSIECPLCKDSFKEMARHIKKKHNMPVNDFKIKFPLLPLKVVSSISKKEISECHLCNCVYKAKNALGLHYKNKHPEYFEEMKKGEKMYKHFECPICNKETNTIRQHIVDGHNMTWESFCTNYNWNIKDSKYVSDEYRKKLSKNKKTYYASEEGIARKKVQSENMLGDKNQARRPEVRSKISKTAIKRMEDNPFFMRSYGIKFKFNNDDKRYFCRSFEELKLVHSLIVNDIEFVYEKTRIKYKMEDDVLRTYVLDFEIDGIYYELKSSLSLSDKDEKKYTYVNKSLSAIDSKLEIVTIKELSKKLNFEIDLDTVYRFCKDKIDSDDMWITNYSYHENSRILNKITKNYKDHPNVKYIIKEIKK